MIKISIFDHETQDVLACWELAEVPQIGTWISHKDRRFYVEKMLVEYDDKGRPCMCEITAREPGLVVGGMTIVEDRP